MTNFLLHLRRWSVRVNGPKDQWAILVQLVLLGKAQITYSSFLEEVRSGYETIEVTIIHK